MDLLVVRHAIAEDKERFAATGRSDDHRPLTEDGRAKMRRAADGLKVVVRRAHILASSPLVRARETAEIIAPALRAPRIELLDALRPDSRFDELAAWLRTRSAPNEHGDAEAGDDERTIAVVGHEPHLSGLVTWLMTGATASAIELKKGAACLLRFDGVPGPGEGTLRWALTPSHLRRLADL
jgi:phosphohistidine phosphatase